MPELASQYSPKDVEERRYQWWDGRGYFRAEPDPARRPYTIVIPPPNVTGILHMGHALNNTIQDILIRYRRMRGDNALWVPGTDHAGIATQNVVEKSLAKEGKRRHDLGREAFIERVWKWKEQYGNTILYQLRRLGASCDWRRTRFTMDEGLSEAVLEVFQRLYDNGLIYRGNYIINWCPRCQTALSDEEAPRRETQGKLFHIRYPIEGSKDQYLEVATTRPETMLGDTAIAVHPGDERYKALVGKQAILPLVGRKLRIIADELVDPAFGTGAVKVTPAHDPADFQMGRKHKLEFINVMTDDAHMTNVPKAYEGLERYSCRSKLIVDLEQEGVLGKVDEHLHHVGHCYRCDTAIEPRLSLQWFVRMKPLAEPAIRAVKDGTIRFAPERWTKVYLNWMENIDDWCISRQIWWGHRIPVWYCGKCLSSGAGNREPKDGAGSEHQQGIIVSKTRPSTCPGCGSDELKQDPDVLDTWFSSWLWPFSTLGWPKKTPELDYFYPTNTLVTAQEIIFFWVARMIMAGYFCMGKPPFTQVYIHGTVRDITGKKMSKSLGNVIDPLEIIEKYGTDALRYTLVTATAIGQDIFLSEERFVAGRNFANKLWNATRFVMSQIEAAPERLDEPLPGRLDESHRWIRSRLARTIERVTKALDELQFNEAASTAYDFLWHDFCDWYIEIAKVRLAGGDRQATLHTLAEVLTTALRLLHPVMPFVSEELWQHLRGALAAKGWGPELSESIMTAPWPTPQPDRVDDEAEQEFGRLMEVVAAVRMLRAELHVPAGTKPAVHIITDAQSLQRFFQGQQAVLQTLAQIGALAVAGPAKRPKHAAADLVDGIEVMMPLAGIIDPDKEQARLRQRITELEHDLKRVTGQLANQDFLSKAPAEVVQQLRARQEQVSASIKKQSQHLATIQSMKVA